MGSQSCKTTLQRQVPYYQPEPPNSNSYTCKLRRLACVGRRTTILWDLVSGQRLRVQGHGDFYVGALAGWWFGALMGQTGRGLNSKSFRSLEQGEILMSNNDFFGCNVAPCLVYGPPSLPSLLPPLPQNTWGPLFNVRQNITNRAAYKYYRHSKSSSHLNMSWLVPANRNSMWAPPAGPRLVEGILQKSFGPGRALFRVPMVNRVRH